MDYKELIKTVLFIQDIQKLSIDCPSSLCYKGKRVKSIKILLRKDSIFIRGDGEDCVLFETNKFDKLLMELYELPES